MDGQARLAQAQVRRLDDVQLVRPELQPRRAGPAPAPAAPADAHGGAQAPRGGGEEGAEQAGGAEGGDEGADHAEEGLQGAAGARLPAESGCGFAW